MGLKNGNAHFPRIMEFVLWEFDFADPCVDDIIIGSTRDTEEEDIKNHPRDVVAVLRQLAKQRLASEITLLPVRSGIL